MRWVVQNNLGKHYCEDIEQACKSLNMEFVPQHIVPFSSKLPDVDTEKPAIFYGATNWINNIYQSNRWKPGVFFNPESTLDNWIKRYGDRALNYDGEITTFAEITKRSIADDEQFFVRPCSDQKEFAGSVMTFAEIKNWQNKMSGDVGWIADIPILFGRPYGIAHEWRLFMVNGRVSSGSHYRTYHKLKEDPNVPPEVIKFGEEMAAVYSPSPVFVLDVGQSGDNLHVIEIGCFNSAGFYASDVERIIFDVSQYAIGT